MGDLENADFRAWLQRRDVAMMDNIQNTISEKIEHQAHEIERQTRERYEGLLKSASELQLAKDAALAKALSRINELEKRIHEGSKDAAEEYARGMEWRRNPNLSGAENPPIFQAELTDVSIWVFTRRPIIVAGDAEGDEGIMDQEETMDRPPSDQQAAISGCRSGPTAAHSKTRRQRPKPPTHIHRLLKEDLDTSQKIVKTAFTTHLRILWGAKDAKAILPSPPAAQVEAFRSRFTSSNDVAAALRSPRVLIDKSLVLISRDYRSQNIGGKSNAAEFLEEDVLDYMQTYCAKYGLYSWCPNLQESPYSVYNSACRLVAIATFKHALSTDSYAFTGVDTVAATDMDILIRIYDHFVHHLQLRLRNKDARSPGSVLRSARLNTIYRRRHTLAAARLKFLRQNGYSRRYQLLVRDPKSNSDDELDSADGQYIIKRRLERSVQVETFFRRLDQMRQTALLQEGGQWRERTRKIVPDQPLSDFPQLPRAMPIDYYSPGFYNGLSHRQKQTFADASVVALPPDASHILVSGNKHVTERMSDKAFYESYAGDILNAYAIDSDSDSDREDTSTRDVSDLASEDGMVIESEDETMAEPSIITHGQIADFVGLAERAGV